MLEIEAVTTNVTSTHHWQYKYCNDCRTLLNSEVGMQLRHGWLNGKCTECGYVCQNGIKPSGALLWKSYKCSICDWDSSKLGSHIELKK